MKAIFLLLLVIPLAATGAQRFRVRASELNPEYTSDDVVAEVEAGKALAARLLGTVKLLENDEAQRYVNRLGAFVASRVGRPELTYYFGVLDSPDTNAYALPGGFIFVTKQALKNAGSERALLGILAHEMGHVNERHAAKEMRIRGGSFLFRAGAAIGGGATQPFRSFLEQLVDQGITLLFRKGLGPEDEFSADRYAAQFLAAEGISTSSYRGFLERVAEGKVPVKIMRNTHPPARERVERLRAFQDFLPEEAGTRTDYEKRYRDLVSGL